ncbi:MAG: diguanylate cyclase, partial [Gammaproteobacteria bacterium]
MTNTSQLELAIAERETPLLLVVDDDIVIRGMLKKALQRQQYDVVEAPNGSEAIEIFRHSRPDLVLLDVLMPVMNGYDACEAMRKLDPERTVPILMLTGLDDVSSVDRAFDAGATDFITKPINWSLFAQRVRYALQARNMDFALRKSQHRIRYALQVAKLGYWDWDLVSNRFDIPTSVLHMLGIENGEELELSDLLTFVPAEDRDKVERAFIDARNKGQAFALEHRVATSEHNQHYVFQQCEVISDDDGKPRHVLGTIQDISALKRAEDMILHQAYHDQLTDLPNQALYKDRLYHALKVAEHSGKKVAVILLDIDRFQVVNESLGHDAGDILLVEFASFLNRFIQDSDTISRISGNEFGLLLESINDMEEVHEVIRNIRQALYDYAFELAGEKVYIKLSMGIALYPDDGFDADNLMQFANSAMRKAKSQGGDQECFYTTNMNRRVHDRLRMERDLRHALEQDQLELYYQPQVAVSDRRIIATEALVRWHHPQHGN